MDQPKQCPQCGAELPSDAMNGLCPQCVARVVFGRREAEEEKPALGEGESPHNGTAERTGAMIGRYKLLEQIGEGGFGVVYMAEQVEPVHRRVALKIIKAGMDTKEVAARFEAERQALALMDHPNIAKILDGGVTGSAESAIGHLKSEIHGGRPYFVMELVKGISITEFCDEKKLSTRERLKLFIQVCHAVQHAHQKGIIHRDLKPSNILVTLHDGEPVPKIIDFGVAKALGQKLTEKTLFTAFAHLIGTPAYMSPEQAELSGLDVDTRSDIYSLGVLLYELLTGVTPFDRETLAKAALDEIRRMIREEVPLRPSTRLTQEIERMRGKKLPLPVRNERGEGGGRGVAEETSGRRVDASFPQPSPPFCGGEGEASDRIAQTKELIHALRGDLDWIVMKCLEKDRRRRYETANGLATDIERHLNCEPVVARPPSKLYEFQKTVRRHKFGFAAAAALVVVLSAGVVVSTWQAIRAKRAEQVAETEAARSQQVAQFMKDMLNGVAPRVALGRDTKLLREILDQTAERIGKELTNQPEVELELRNAISDAYQAIGQHAAAESNYRRTVELTRKLYGNEHSSLGDALHRFGECLRREGKCAEAETAEREAMAIYRRVYGEEHPAVAAVLNNLIFVLDALNRHPEAVIAGRQALVMNERLLGKDHPAVGVSLSRLGRVLMLEGNLQEAEKMERRAVALQRKLIELQSPDRDPLELPWALYYLAQVLQREGKLAEAEDCSREAIMEAERVTEAAHPNVAIFCGLLIDLLVQQGKLGEAQEEITRQLQVHGRESESIAQAMLRAGNAMRWHAQTKDEAVRLILEGYDLAKQHGDSIEDVDTYPLGLALQERGDFAEAEHYLHMAAVQRRNSGYRRFEVPFNALVRLLLQQGRTAEAERLYEEELTTRKGHFGENSPMVAEWLLRIADFRVLRGKTDEALSLYHEAGKHGDASTLNTLAWLHATSGDPKFRDGTLAVRYAQKAVAETSRTNASYLDALAAACAEAEQFDEAMSVQQEAIALQQNEQAKRGYVTRLKLYEARIPYRNIESVARAATALLAEGRRDAAGALAREGLAIVGMGTDVESPDFGNAQIRLADVLRQLGQSADAQTLFSEGAKWATPNILNELAWSMATAPQPERRNGPTAVELAEKAVAATTRENYQILDTLAAAYAEAGQFANAVDVQREAIALLSTNQPNLKVDFESRLRLFESREPYREYWREAERLRNAGKSHEAEGLLRKELEMRQKILFPDDPNLSGYKASLTQVLIENGKFIEAELYAHECVRVREEKLPDNWLTFNARSLLGGALLGQEKYEDAEPLLLSGYEGMRQREDKIPEVGKLRIKEALVRLVQLYEDWDKPDRAAEWRKKLAEFNEMTE